MLEHPAVLEVAITGVPDTIRGFNVKATVVLKNGPTASDELAMSFRNTSRKTPRRTNIRG